MILITYDLMSRCIYIFVTLQFCDSSNQADYPCMVWMSPPPSFLHYKLYSMYLLLSFHIKIHKVTYFAYLTVHTFFINKIHYCILSKSRVF